MVCYVMLPGLDGLGAAFAAVFGAALAWAAAQRVPGLRRRGLGRAVAGLAGMAVFMHLFYEWDIEPYSRPMQAGVPVDVARGFLTRLLLVGLYLVYASTPLWKAVLALYPFLYAAPTVVGLLSLHQVAQRYLPPSRPAAWAVAGLCAGWTLYLAWAYYSRLPFAGFDAHIKGGGFRETGHPALYFHRLVYEGWLWLTLVVAPLCLLGCGAWLRRRGRTFMSA